MSSDLPWMGQVLASADGPLSAPPLSPQAFLRQRILMGTRVTVQGGRGLFSSKRYFYFTAILDSYKLIDTISVSRATEDLVFMERRVKR